MEIPIGGGVLLKWGHATAQPKVREFRFNEDDDGGVTIVYKTHKLMAKAEAAEMNLTTFFVHKVRPATEAETKLVTQFASKNTVFTLSAKRCFNVDFYDPHFAPAVGPAKMKTITIFPAPDASLAEVWSFLSTVMMEEGVFGPSADDPDVPELLQIESVKVVQTRRASVSSVDSEDCSVEPPKKSIFDTANATALLNSLPQPTEEQI